MDRHQVRWALLKITTVILGVSTWIFWSFVFATRPEQARVDTLASLVRLPASLPAALAPTTKVAAPVRMDVLPLSCWDQPEHGKTQSVGARWVRLTGKACGKEHSGGFTVLNRSNGYVATVFAARPGDLTTDFIPLEAGGNEIEIRYESTPGARVENRFVLTRE
ncbi:MAG TPA: hypothetical protein PKC28_09845 [Bdellovibrionales bacterium]|nr:hypothetical protein [Bdellovibrionales bacterium]